MTLIQTFTGRAVSLLTPDVDSISKDDLTVALSRISRFNGHTTHSYSVAQHCTLVATIVKDTSPNDHAAVAWAYLHDAHEAFTGDITSPMQRAIESLLPRWLPSPIKCIQLALDQAIAAKFGIDWIDVVAVSDLVKRADMIALATEKKQLMVTGPKNCEVDLPPPIEEELLPLSSASAGFTWASGLERALHKYHWSKKLLAAE